MLLGAEDCAPWRRLAVAVLLRAVKDAQRGDVSASEWLQGPGMALATVVDLEAGLERWLCQETSTKVNNRQQIHRSEENVEEC